MNREEQIGEAAKAIAQEGRPGWSWETADEWEHDLARAEARAAFAVFEKAHTPTNDERVTVDVEALDRGWGTLDQRMAGTILAVIAHYGPKWREAGGGDQANEIARALQAGGYRRSEPQGEPSDAQVGAALESYWGYPDGYSRGQFEKMRAALRAARGVR